jgi:hypothetical protein
MLGGLTWGKSMISASEINRSLILRASAENYQTIKSQR